MTAKWIEAITGSLEQKKQYKQDMARIEALPPAFRTAAKAVNRYLMYYSGQTDGETLTRMVTDQVDLWERAALDGLSIRDVVGEDPVAFAEDFARSYGGKEWIDKERARLVRDIDGAAGS
ncbi:DUF1048 domain-containing protein [Brachybacterium hainanense]|uniref:DUF1048 domain-containing protein n=1 Tax=Brachybacterium hainanense TaxID=1541174 RepID=A0ABV6R9K6_9MICO